MKAEWRRPDPDALLSAVQREDSARGRGRLKVFLGMCPGVGKTFAMLEAAKRELAAGRDVLAGYVETHDRPETRALAEGLPAAPRRRVEHRGVELSELDLDAVLNRRPALALVDELAHTNAPGSRHPKRYQDIQELLEAGIDVFTTLNIQHVESRADTVRQVTGVEVRETVPDSVLDDAELELVDLPPAELLRRLRDGKVYVPDRAATAARNFFREANLAALRELSLRLVADHVGGDTDFFRRTDSSSGPWKTGNLLLVAVGPGPLSEPLIRWTRRMADELQCRWLAAHIEGVRVADDEAQAQLAKNLATARELGAETITSTDEDVARGLLRIARERNVTQIIIGKPGGGSLLGRWRAGRSFRRLLRESGDIDLHVVRAEKNAPKRPGWRPAAAAAPEAKQYVLAAAVIGAVGAANLALLPFSGPRVPGLIFLLAVVLLALFAGRGPVLAAGALSAVVWNYFFLSPRFTFVIERAEDALFFGVYFVVSMVLGQLVARIRAQSEAERRREERSTALYELTRELAEAGTRDQVVWQLVAEVNRVMHAPSAVSLAAGEDLRPHPDSTLALSEKEISVSDWAFRQRKAAGKFTDNLPGAGALHLPLMTERKAFGVLAVELGKSHLTLAQRELLEAFARQAALVLDRLELRAAAEQARVLAESERLGRALLNSISHEMRTPIAAIAAGANSLGQPGGGAPQQAIAAEIQAAAQRLNRLVANLLNASRVESGRLQPKLEWHDPGDILNVAFRGLEPELSRHQARLEIARDLPLIRVDFALIEQALANLLHNAAVHAPAGSEVVAGVAADATEVRFTVSDNGPGIPPESVELVFDRFYRAPGGRPGGIGLGLSIVKSFVEAQGGTVSAGNRAGGGAVFEIAFRRETQPQLPEEA